MSFIRYEVGVGSKIRFWHDLWWGNNLLKIVFSELLVLLDVRRHEWRIICSPLVEYIFYQTSA